MGSLCPKCQSRLKFQGERIRKVQFSPSVTSEVSRAYYTCRNKDCRHTEYPLDPILNLSRGRANGLFKHLICFLSAQMPYDRVRECLRLFWSVNVSQSMIRETAQGSGLALIKEEEKLADELEEGCTDHVQSVDKIPEELYIQADGSMVPICPEKGREKRVQYRENKLAVFFGKEDLKAAANKSRSKPSYKIMKKRFVSSLGQGVQHFEKLVKKRAFEMGAQTAKTMIFLSDGAVWLDALRERLFPHSIHILDWYHAVEHLYNCARRIFGESAHERIKQWAAPLKELLYEGRASEVCERLLFEACKYKKHETVIRELYGYYHCRLEKMKYAEFRKKGYFIGSGAIESANKYLVQARLKQAGMKWLTQGASAMIHLREKIYEGNWQHVENYYKKANFSYK